MPRLRLLLISFALLVNLCLCSALSYWGIGAREVGPNHPVAGDTVRDGSLGGPSMSGGGPGSGK